MGTVEKKEDSDEDKGVKEEVKVEEEDDDDVEENERKLAILQQLVKEMSQRVAKKRNPTPQTPPSNVRKSCSADSLPSESEFQSPPPKIPQSWQSPPPKIPQSGAAHSPEAEFVHQTWTPSPRGKQMTLTAALKRVGVDAKVVTTSSPGAKKTQSLKDVLTQQVCKG